MMVPFLALALAAASPTPVAVAAPQVEVTLGPALQAKVERYGPREVEELRTDLARTVAPAAARGGFTRLQLVLEDARPNRPTPAMLVRQPYMSLNSIALGGAKITGTAYGPGGARPLKYGWYETELRNELGPATWSDAGYAFQRLSAQLARGRVPDAYPPGTPTGDPGFPDPRDPWTRTD